MAAVKFPIRASRIPIAISSAPLIWAIVCRQNCAEPVLETFNVIDGLNQISTMTDERSDGREVSYLGKRGGPVAGAWTSANRRRNRVKIFLWASRSSCRGSRWSGKIIRTIADNARRRSCYCRGRLFSGPTRVEQDAPGNSGSIEGIRSTRSVKEWLSISKSQRYNCIYRKLGHFASRKPGQFVWSSMWRSMFL